MARLDTTRKRDKEREREGGRERERGRKRMRKRDEKDFRVGVTDEYEND